MKKTITVLILVTIVFSISGCNIIESVKWMLGAVDYGKIRGTITDIDGNPVVGMTVTAYPTSEGTASILLDDETNANGEYILTMVPPGVHRIEGKLSGYEIVAQEDITCCAGQYILRRYRRCNEGGCGQLVFI